MWGESCHIRLGTQNHLSVYVYGKAVICLDHVFFWRKRKQTQGDKLQTKDMGIEPRPQG